MKREYVLFTAVSMTVEEYHNWHKEIQNHFDSKISDMMIKISLTDKELVMFKLKYGHVVNPYLII